MKQLKHNSSGIKCNPSILYQASIFLSANATFLDIFLETQKIYLISYLLRKQMTLTMSYSLEMYCKEMPDYCIREMVIHNEIIREADI